MVYPKIQGLIPTILLKHRSFQKPTVSLVFWWFPEKKDPWKEWNWKVALEKRAHRRTTFNGCPTHGHMEPLDLRGSISWMPLLRAI